MYCKDKKKLAREILDDISPDAVVARPSSEDIKAAYDKIFGTEGRTADKPLQEFIGDGVDIHEPIHKENIQDTIKKLRKTSAGPDGIDSARLPRIPFEKLEFVHNLMLYSKYVPELLRISCTIFIPEGKDLLQL